MAMIRRLLIANRGEIARRIIRSAAAMGISTVAVYSDADEAMPHTRDADLAVRLPGSSAAETYLRGDLIIAAARASGADAIHPGYGFLAENAGFARACEAAGLIWVGPPASAIEAMGSKLSAKALVSAAGVPVLESVAVASAVGSAGASAVGSAASAADDGPTLDLAAAGERIGFPLLVKASAGGGGRGMRVVRSAGELAGAVESAGREALAAFGDGTVFLESYLEGAHHVEIQVLADAHGGCVSLFERDCSVQRRHQKIIEECPSPVVTPELRAAMGSTAVDAARSVGYVGAGTVEFLMSPSTGRFVFLEMNTRLQVEHPVTEMVTGLDLVRLQLEVAEGAVLPAAVHEAVARGPVGWSVEARLYAEDPGQDWRPSTGRLHLFSVPETGARVDAGVETGSVVSPYYDPMLAKVIAVGSSREEACRILARTLAEARVHGVTTNRDLLVGILGDAEFLSGAADVQYLERRGVGDFV
ncbi:MAG TPA: biotin carboxylase N-terminal domain-containing protein, partial [Acidimicrobiales bacterium]|nr:biotin carboxylase N-terminal domain-containing protein [Acidimicrobiales bacterium]